MDANKKREAERGHVNTRWPDLPQVAGHTGIPATPDMVYEPDAAATTARRGRNEACWCGSGKKYKRCHLAEDLRRG